MANGTCKHPELTKVNDAGPDIYICQECRRLISVEEFLVQKTETSRGTKEKYATLVGIDNYDNPSLALNGCKNDVNDAYDYLTKSLQFAPDNIRVLVDARARKAEILDRIRWMGSKVAQPETTCVAFQSSHGSQLRDRDGDELNDGMDECLIAYDLGPDWTGAVIDDEIRAAMDEGTGPAGIHPTSRFIFVVDACHSGTMTRNSPPFGSKQYKIRYAPPPMDIALRSLGRDLSITRIAGTMASNRHILISGCLDNQTSAETEFNGQVRGAMSYNLFSTLREMGNNLTWEELIGTISTKLANTGFSQRPSLTVPQDLLQEKFSASFGV
jgi:hypothetical protein